MSASSWLRSEPPQSAPTGPPAPPWHVLLVDDAPEIHEVTRLVLAGAAFSGRPIELTSAHSAAEARAYLSTHKETALILLDVVMEADDAGLALVRHIRDSMQNHDVQIVLRTGQPGMAPERDVITHYEINGYFLKTELTAQKLTSIVVTGLRTYETIRALRDAHTLAASPHPFVPVDAARVQSLRTDLDAAIANDTMSVHALPQIALASGETKCIELRPAWPTRDGAYGPERIAASMSDTPLLLSLDTMMLRRACIVARDQTSCVSVPLLSRESIHVVRTFLDGHALDLQLSAAVLQEHQETARALQAMGVSITLKDFGLERISLPDLQALRPDRIRIHASFVTDVTRHHERAVVARAIVALAHTLGVVAIADGVNSSEDLQFFRWEGCDLGQGDALAAARSL